MEKKKKYSERSRSSAVEETRLRAEQHTLEDKKVGAEREAAEADKEVKRLRDAASRTNDSILDYNLSQALQRRNAKLDIAKSCGEGIREKQAAIAALAPSEEDGRTRAKLQASVESSVSKREETDRKIGATVEALRGLLAEHRAQTEEMQALAEALEVALPAASFDAAALLAALPEGIAEAGERWAGHFLGEPKGSKTYIVRAEYLSVPETLAHHGCYRFGEEIRLDPEEAAELLANDYAAPVRSAPWRRLPARVMTVEDFQKAKAQAEQRKVSVAQIVFEEDIAQDARDRAYYQANMVSPVSRRRAVSKDGEIAFGTALKVSGRALGNVSGPHVGESHKAGDIVEDLTLPQAWQLVDVGVLAPL
jgi:hypothetical protein